MDYLDELKLDIQKKRKELEKLRNEKDYPRASLVADELNELVNKYDAESAFKKTGSEKYEYKPRDPSIPPEGFENLIPLNANSGSHYFNNKRGGIAGESYSKSFWSAVRARFKNQAGSYLRESSLPDGGYLVPEEFHSAIVTELEQENVLRQLGTTITTAAKHKIPIVSTKDFQQEILAHLRLILVLDTFKEYRERRSRH